MAGAQTGATTVAVSVGTPQKLGLGFPSDPTIPLLNTFLKELKASRHSGVWRPRFIVAQFAMTQSWKQPKYPPTSEWIKEAWFLYHGVLPCHKEG